MPDYLIQLKYETKAIEKLIAKPHSREEFIRPEIEKLGGQIKDLWFSFEEYDVIGLMTLPDKISMEALVLAAKSTGFIKDFKAMCLLSMDESVEAMKKASIIKFKMPD